MSGQDVTAATADRPSWNPKFLIEGVLRDIEIIGQVRPEVETLLRDVLIVKNLERALAAIRAPQERTR